MAKRLRAGGEVPILLLTARGATADKLAGLALGAGFLGYGYPGGMMGGRGSYGYPGGMMGGWGWGGLLGMVLMGLVGIACLALFILGIAWLVRQTTPPAAPPPAASPTTIAAVCPSCHKGVQADWTACPYCEQKLK